MKKQVKNLLIFVSILFMCFLTILGIRYISSLPYALSQKEKPPPVEEESNLTSEPVKIEMKIFPGKIEPKEFRAKSGQKIILSIVSMEGKHSIVFEGLGLSWLRADFDEPGETFEINFFAPAKGEYRFFCKEPGHQENGEEGFVIVE